jgi:hypothetical protein
MKAKFCSIALVAAAAALIAASGAYVASLASRTRSLEARLARVEAALNAKETMGLAKNGATPLLRIAPVSPPAGQTDSLERRVEKIEQELRPHFQLLSPARPDAPAIIR